LRFVDELGLFCAGGVCVDDFFGLPTDVTKDAFSDINNACNSQPLAEQTSWEAGFVYMYGKLTLNCIDENGVKRKHFYSKHCLGVAAGAGVGYAGVTNSQGSSCSHPPSKLIGVEGSAEIGTVDFEVGTAFVMKNNGGQSWSIGLSKGLGLKAGVKGCVYFLLSSEIEK